ncbi:tryptophan synthase subunit alpha [Hyphobacterium sp. HN65]|uniref:Tryptophan synthase alpha chain n=1 Tax=Hyphobacterium lacteum TaxID=3116575 RepID=A0ABU7LSC0_9PROT|nr:tryptophan synthase subunit alpha [Hyphobacterium sp. HN65]MEE2526818.1 tryptophan synthase subunit alpha [Hyphobacterium sp. HN65]
MITKTSGGHRLATAIRAANEQGHAALIAFLTGGYPDRERFIANLAAITQEADIVEIGVPFSDPVADGPTIQNSSRTALAGGVSLSWILQQTAARDWDAPLVIMSYLNPILAMGFASFAERAAASHIDGVIIPDLPLEECAPLQEALAARDIALIQLVTPVTPDSRLAPVCEQSDGFVYAVTSTGVTGGNAGASLAQIGQGLDRIRAVTRLPVCTGFGLRSADDVAALSRHADGVIVGSALIEAIGDGRDAAGFLRDLRPRNSKIPA